MDEDVVVVKPAYADAYVDAVKRARAMMSELEDDPSTSGGASWTWREGADAVADVIDGCGRGHGGVAGVAVEGGP